MSGVDTDVRVSFAKRTDLGNAQRLTARHAELIRYVHATQTWHIWDGAAWAPDDTGQIERYARDTVRAMHRAAAEMPEGEDDKDARSIAKAGAAKWAAASESAARLGAMVQLARAEPGIAVPLSAFDLEPWELNCPNGIVDLRTGKLRGADPAAMHTQSAAVPYTRAAKAPQWEEFLCRVLPDKAVRLYVHRLLGASLIGSPLPGHQFPFLFGSGGTGKSTLLETVADVLGDYARIAPATLLARKPQGASQTYDVASLRGRRFVVVEELSGAIDDNMLKLITAAKTLAARQIREAETEFTNVTSLWMASNHEPRIDGSDTGLRRRVKQIVMDVVLDGPGYVGPLKAHIAAEEREGVLAWLVRGCVAAAKDGGLVEPEAVATATTELFSSNNPLLEWFDACCSRDENAVETGPALHASYDDWCTARRRRIEYRSGKSATWARALKSIGLEPSRSAATRGYRGARLQQPAL